jgi:formylglycine-generating enzyme required for sulfatase activity
MVDDFACTDCVQHGARRVGGGTQGNGPGSTAGLSGPGNGANGVFRDKTIELGSFRPNAFGLYDMHGNVWEWVLNCYERYEGAPVDGSAVADTRNGSRVAAGLFWTSPWPTLIPRGMTPVRASARPRTEVTALPFNCCRLSPERQ